MAIKQAPSMSKTIYQGEAGNLSFIHDTVTLADAIGDTTEVRELPVGVTVTGVRLITTGTLGAASTIQVFAGDVALTDTIASTAALNKTINIKPVYLGENANLGIKTAGGATTGAVTLGLEYLYTGY